MHEVMNCRQIWKPQLLQMNNSRFSATGTVYRHTVLTKYKIRKFNESPKRSSSEPPPRKRNKRSASASDFCFQTHCIFCGKKCFETRDSKNPSRWHSVSRVRTVQQGDKSLKEAILTACKERTDTWAQEVQLRVLGAFRAGN